MVVSPQQDEALKAIDRWLRDPSGRQVFRLFGLAGTGKTTIAKRIAEQCSGAVLFAAYTGKAALVLTQKGCPASTIHRLLYHPFEDDEGKVQFARRRGGLGRHVALIIIDECSMVDGRLGRDLLALGARILVLGDPFQLPPVFGAGYFTAIDPDFLLTEIHRQARDNPIIVLADRVRRRESIAIDRYGESRIARIADVGSAEVMAADQVLVGRNLTRRTVNRRVRLQRGKTDPLPVPGDRLVCLRNDAEKGLLNGGLWSVEATNRKNGCSFMSLSGEANDPPLSVKVRNEFFGDFPGAIERRFSQPEDEFDFGYALTVHKAQGSQWDHVVLRDESDTFGPDAARWLYTGITRAAQKVTVIVQ